MCLTKDPDAEQLSLWTVKKLLGVGKGTTWGRGVVGSTSGKEKNKGCEKSDPLSRDKSKEAKNQHEKENK